MDLLIEVGLVTGGTILGLGLFVWMCQGGTVSKFVAKAVVRVQGQIPFVK